MSEPSVRVLVVDDDPRVQADLEEMLEPLGYDVRAAEGHGDTLIEEAEQIARHFRPHIAIVDLRLWDDRGPDQSGLKVIEAFPSAHCILYSAFLNFEVLRNARADRVSWVSKAEPPEELIEAVEDASRKTCARCSELHIYAPDGWSPRKIVKTLFSAHDLPPSGIVDDLIRQLFPTSHTVTLQNLEEDPTRLDEVGRGRSMVAKVWQDDRVNPLVLKLGPAEQIKKEVANYDRYIKGNIGGLFCANIQDQPRYFWDLGGVLYTFMGTPRDDLHSFAQFYSQNQDPDAILWPLHHLLHDVWGHFYRAARPETQPLYAAYDRVLNLKKRLEGRVAQGLKWPPRLAGVPSNLPNPVDWVQRHKNGAPVPETRMAVTHGDLHGDNLFVDPDHTWVIDFERSGPGPILRDVTELEVDILTRLAAPGSGDAAAFYGMANAVARSTRPETPLRAGAGTVHDLETLKALDTIQRLRILAHREIQIPDLREYLWGVLLDALFVGLLSSTSALQQERALLLSAVLCERLERWEP